MDITIRKATPADASDAASLLAATMADYGVMTLGLGDSERQINVLSTWFQRPGNRFSYEYSWLALADGKPAGLLLVFGGKDLDRLENALAKGIFKLYHPGELLRMLWRMYVLGHTDEAAKDEFVLAHLAVKEEFRRQGIALYLMEKAVSEAQAHGYGKLSLEVEIGNLPAETLYSRFGFNYMFTTEFSRRAQVLRCPGYHHMVKEI